MSVNISKYVQLNDFILLEYEFNKAEDETSISDLSIAQTLLGKKYTFQSDSAINETNNVLPFNAIPTNLNKTEWFIDYEDYDITYPLYWDSVNNLSIFSYPLDNIKIHILSGYNFDDIGGFLLQIGAKDVSNNLVDLSNFCYIKQPQIIQNNVIQFSSQALFLGNRFYDKFIEIKIPSIQKLGGDNVSSIGQALNVNALSDVYVTYSTIYSIIEKEFTLNEQIKAQLPVTSVADNFSCHISESSSGDYIEYFATWNDFIIGDYMSQIESGRIRLYTSNNPNDNAENFVEQYGMTARKWVIIHEISVFEHIPGGTSLLAQKYSFTQDGDFSQPNYFRPVLLNADISSSYSIQYTCRLLNRMDGSQIIRKASFSSMEPKKYGLHLNSLVVNNIIPYIVFNKVENEVIPNINNNTKEKVKYIKVFYDTVNVNLNMANELIPQGVGPLFLKDFDSTYMFKFEVLKNGERSNVDLSGVFNYALVFKLDDNSKIEILPTYSSNMNTVLGQLEFKILEDQSSKLRKQKNNSYSIVVKNPNGTEYTFYQGKYHSLSDYDNVMYDLQSMQNNNSMLTYISELEQQIQQLTQNNNE